MFCFSRLTILFIYMNAVCVHGVKLKYYKLRLYLFWITEYFYNHHKLIHSRSRQVGIFSAQYILYTKKWDYENHKFKYIFPAVMYFILMFSYFDDEDHNCCWYIHRFVICTIYYMNNSLGFCSHIYLCNMWPSK